jgi:DNA-binding MarR family transcriptional regulator
MLWYESLSQMNKPMTPKKPVTNQKLLISTNQSDAQSTRVLRQFRLIFSSVRRHFQLIEKSAGVGGAQIWALSLVQQEPGIAITKLAEEMDVHQSTASNLVKAMIKAGFVQSEKSEEDKRVAELYILPAGIKLLKKVPRPYAGVLPKALEELPPDRLKSLEQDLNDLIKIIEVAEEDAKTPLAMM